MIGFKKEITDEELRTITLKFLDDWVQHYPDSMESFAPIRKEVAEGGLTDIVRIVTHTIDAIYQSDKELCWAVLATAIETDVNPRTMVQFFFHRVGKSLGWW